MFITLPNKKNTYFCYKYPILLNLHRSVGDKMLNAA